MRKLFFLIFICFVLRINSYSQNPSFMVQLGHSAPVTALCISSDDKYLASCSKDGTMRLWDIKTGRLIRIYKCNSEANAVAISPDNKYIASGGKVWEINSDKIIKEYPKSESPVLSFIDNNTITVEDTAFSINNNNAVSGKKGLYSPNTEYRLFFNKQIILELEKCSTSKKLLSFEDIFNFSPFAFNSKSNFLLVYYKMIKLYDLSSEKYIDSADITPIGSFGKSISCVAVDNDASQIAVGCGYVDAFITSTKSDTTIRLINRINKSESRILAGHSGKVTCLAFSHSGKILISGGHDKLIKLWDVATGKLLRTLGNVTTPVPTVRFHPSDSILMISSGGSAVVWNIALANVKHKIEGHKGLTGAADYSPDSKFIVTAGFDKNIKIWDAQNFRFQKMLRGHSNRITDIAISTDGKMMATVTSGGVLTDKIGGAGSSFDKKYNVKLWNLETGRSVKTVYGTEKVVFSPDGKYFATSTGGLNMDDSNNGETKSPEDRRFSVTVYITETGEKFADITTDSYSSALAFSSDGKNIVIGNKGIVMMDLTNGKIIQEFEAPTTEAMFYHETYGSWTNALCLSHNGKLLATGDINNSLIRIWNVEDGKLIATLRGHLDGILSLSFSRDDRFLASSSLDTQIKLWKMSDFSEVVTFISLQGSDDYVAYAPDGYYTATKGATKAVHFVLGNKIFTFEQFDELFNRPDIIIKRLSMATKEQTDMYTAAVEKRKILNQKTNTGKNITSIYNVPEVVIKNVSLFDITTNPVYNLSVAVSDSLSMLDKINVFVNGVPLCNRPELILNSFNTKTAEKNIKIDLSPGNNIIEVSAQNVNSIESLKERMEIIYNSPQPKGNLYLIAISVSKYVDSKYNLDYARKDGRDFVSAFKTQTVKYKNIFTDTLFDEKATRANFTNLSNKLRNSKEDDEVILYVSGHGLLDKNLDFYYATNDIDFKNPAKNGIGFNEIEKMLSCIPARKKLLLIDACHSGEVDRTETTKEVAIAKTSSGDSLKIVAGARGVMMLDEKPAVGLNNSFELMQEIFSDVSKKSGLTVISAASGTGFALESAQWNNGVFTYSLINGLKSGDADRNHDGIITVSELKNYVINTVDELTRGKQKPTSRRENNENDWIIW
ncbi:MAG: caspase family protein [Bacteroidales bacterium]|nr:caspase family protein [Bacteroidales bacterium]